MKAAGIRSASPSVKDFAGDVGKKPSTVSASKLDANFAAVTVINPPDESYRVEYDAKGIILANLRGVPDGATARQFNVCDNGTPRTYWMLTWDTEPEL